MALLCALPCSANPTARFDEALKAQSIPIDGVSGSGPSCRIDFRPSATLAQRDQANAYRGTFDWDAGDPNPETFQDAVASDASMPVQIYQYIPFIARLANKEAKRKAVWAKATSSPPAWLTPAVISAIESYASTANMPLK